MIGIHEQHGLFPVNGKTENAKSKRVRLYLGYETHSERVPSFMICFLHDSLVEFNVRVRVIPHTFETQSPLDILTDRAFPLTPNWAIPGGNPLESTDGGVGT